MNITHQRTLYSIFADYAALQPEKEWLVFERADGQVLRWRYGEFLASVHQAAHLLRGLGVGAGDVFNLHLSNHPAYPQLILAASLLGAVALPSNPVSTPDELRYLLHHAEAKAVFTDSTGLATATETAPAGCPILLIDSPNTAGYPVYAAELAKHPTTPPNGAGATEKVVEILYTSGTTSLPKGVMLTNANIIFAVECFRAAIGMSAQDRPLIVLPLFHGAAQIHALWVALVAGASVAIMHRFSASRFFQQAIDYQATLAPMFGAPLRMLLNQPPQAQDAAHPLRNITFAQNLTPEQYATWERRFKVPLQQLWGMTETCGLPIVSPLSGRRNLLAMGRPALGYEVKIVDEQEQEVGAGETGQLMVRGVPGYSLMAGYLKDPQTTAQTLKTQPDGSTWLYTGDTVYADAEGFIYFVDRGKDLIKRAGERISSTEIESVVRGCPGVVDACVVSIPDPVRDEAIVAVVVAQTPLSAQSIIDHCAARLSAFKVPEKVVFVDELPRTSVGKIQKNKVQEQIKHD